MESRPPRPTPSDLSGRAWFLDRVNGSEPLVLPGAFDCVSARLIERAGFEALYCSGYAAVASALGQPDLGLAGFAEMHSIYRRIRQSSTLPMIVDADAGYGGALNVRRTVEEFGALPVAAVQIEDQVNPKRCGQLETAVAPLSEAVLRVRAAVRASGSEGPAIIARVDAVPTEGLASAIDRANRYLDEGAAAIFVGGLRSESDLLRVREGVRGPLMFNSAKSGQREEFTPDALREIGIAIVIYPIEPLFAAYAAVETLLADVRAGLPVPEAGEWQRPPFERFNSFLGLPELTAWEESIQSNTEPVSAGHTLGERRLQ